jgi:hypothetical protein
MENASLSGGFIGSFCNLQKYSIERYRKEFKLNMSTTH